MTILNDYMYSQQQGIIYGTVLLIIGIAIIVICIVLRDGCIAGFGVGMIIAGAVWLMVGLTPAAHRIQCTIDDSVSFTYIQEHYKVIDQDGLIWTLEELDEPLS